MHWGSPPSPARKTRSLSDAARRTDGVSHIALEAVWLAERRKANRKACRCRGSCTGQRESTYGPDQRADWSEACGEFVYTAAAGRDTQQQWLARGRGSCTSMSKPPVCRRTPQVPRRTPVPLRRRRWLGLSSQTDPTPPLKCIPEHWPRRAVSGGVGGPRSGAALRPIPRQTARAFT
jgi:hypothetical protein